MKRGGILSMLISEPISGRIETLAAEHFLSRKPFPIELFSEEIRREFTTCVSWLESLPRRDAQELSYSVLIQNAFPTLQGSEHEYHP
ncbi:MAG: hypothetical protein KDD70_03910 [Bdellovibrionales bacterium]|nr:hypothetical protein [Bdellovibrionales bacterium]